MLKKRVFAGILMFIFALTAFPISVLASPSLDDQLRRRGYPDALIDIMLDEEKQGLIDEDCYYESSVIYNYGENSELLYTSSYDAATIIPFGQIKATSLSLSITTSKSGSNTVVTFNYDWKKLPVNRFQDPICVGWDSSVFQIKAGTGAFKRMDKYNLNVGGHIKTATQTNDNSFASSSGSSITWYADLKGYSAKVVALFGYGQFTLVPKKKGQNTVLYGNYVHARLAGSLSVSFSGVGFSISGTASHDELGINKNVKS